MGLGNFATLVILLCSCGAMMANRHSGHSHHIPKKDAPGNVLKDKEYLRDYEHIKEDMRDLYNEEFSEKLDEQDLEVYYFQLHDLNNDKLLDGLELLAAMNHVMDREKEMPKADIDDPTIRRSLQLWWNDKFEEDSRYIDEILKEEDLDQDGYLSYLEFAIGRQKERGEI